MEKTDGCNRPCVCVRRVTMRDFIKMAAVARLLAGCSSARPESDLTAAPTVEPTAKSGLRHQPSASSRRPCPNSVYQRY